MKFTVKRRLLLITFIVAALLSVTVSALVVSSFLNELPATLGADLDSGTRIEDRDGRLLARTMGKGGVFIEPLHLENVGPHLEKAMIAAEDKRYRVHPGVDALAVLRAGAQALYHGRLVSGASTITQQLARSCFNRPRTLAGKWREMSLALHIERRLSKDEILEEYLNRVHFGPNIIGARAAADHYFGKALPALDLSEVATLAGLVRGPSLYDPRRRPLLAQKRRDKVLARMREAGFITIEEEKRAKSLTVEVHPRPPLPGANHWVRVVAQLAPGTRIRSTLHGPLQHEVQALVAQHRRRLDADTSRASAASVVVLDNNSGDILAYVGSPEFYDDKRAGQNDGAQAMRQPGSTLKPFIYAQAIDELNLSPASLLPDSPTQFHAGGSHYAPRNFDRKFRGAVTLRRALANSLNVPAVFLLEKLGEQRVLRTLRTLGLTSLTRDASHYGPALALGDGEVSLVALTASYAALARGGRSLNTRFRRDAPASTSAQVFSPEASALITEVLSDDAARREAFGRENALDLPFPVAVKTGTSKGYRDTWTVGYTRSITIGVWVGNFDGSPTARLTGARGAAPLFHEVMNIATDTLGRPATTAGATRPLHDVPLEKRDVCHETGAPPSTTCKLIVQEWFSMSQPSAVANYLGAAPNAAARIEYPRDGMKFDYEPSISRDRQTLFLKARAREGEPITFVLNGRRLIGQQQKYEWPVERGNYQLWVESPGQGRSPGIAFTVN